MRAAPRGSEVDLRCRIDGLESAGEVLGYNCHAVASALDLQGAAEACNTGTIFRR